jgi:hypothetical protein
MSTKEQQIIDMFDNLLEAWLGKDRRQRLDAVAPGAGLSELIAVLRDNPQDRWPQLCAVHARERAADVCLYHKPGDLWYRGGEYWWTRYWTEFHDALKIVTGSPRVNRLKIYDPAMAAAREAFCETAEHLRDRLTGYTAAEREALDEAGAEIELECSETLAEACERERRQRGAG